MCWIKSFGRFLFIYLVAPISLLVALLGGSLLVVASPSAWVHMYVAPEKLGEHAQADGELIAAHLWTDRSYDEVSRDLKGGKLVQRERVHYEDLQGKFLQLKALVFVSGLVAFSAFFFKQRERVVVASLSWLVTIVIAGGVWSMINWRGMFRALHWWVFQDDSWILPRGCYSLRLFPYSVWKEAMVWMVVLSLSAYLILWVAARVLSKKLSL